MVNFKAVHRDSWRAQLERASKACRRAIQRGWVVKAAHHAKVAAHYGRLLQRSDFS